MSNHSDRVCIRGCVEDRHFAACRFHGPDYHGDAPCKGCVPRPCRDGSMICDRCFGRARALLRDAPDIVGRIRSLLDPSKVKSMNPTRAGSSGPVGADASLESLAELIEASDQIIRGLRGLSLWVEPDAWGHAPARHGLGPVAAARSVGESCSILLDHLPAVSNDVELAGWLSIVVLDVHKPDADGGRAAWSVQDAADRWGAERRVKGEPSWVPDDPGTVEVTPIAEWGSDVMTTVEAAVRLGTDQRTVQRWIKKAGVVPAATYREGRAHRRLFRVAELVAARAAHQSNEQEQDR
jgi:hypothetical protein